MRWCGASDMPRAGASWHIQIESSILASPVPFPSEELLLLQAQLISARSTGSSRPRGKKELVELVRD